VTELESVTITQFHIVIPALPRKGILRPESILNIQLQLVPINGFPIRSGMTKNRVEEIAASFHSSQ
jgi:hypothetical protein